jgi:hypothetical protein
MTKVSRMLKVKRDLLAKNSLQDDKKPVYGKKTNSQSDV